MRRGAVRTDSERLVKAAQDQAFLDTSPTKPQLACWDLRRRDKSSEMGRQFRFDANLQVQRIMDTLQNNVSRYVPSSEINCGGKNSRSSNAKALREFVKSGEHDFVPGADASHIEDELDRLRALRREKKIHQTNYIIEPNKIMPTFHKKIYFKASQEMGLSQGNMKITTRLHNEEFLNAQANLL